MRLKNFSIFFIVLFLVFSGCEQPKENTSLKTPTSTPENISTTSTPTPRYYEPTTEIEYPGSSTIVSLPNISLDKFKYPSPYEFFGKYPTEGARDIPIDTYINLYFPRPPEFIKLEIKPEVKISHVKKELVFYSGNYTFYPAEPLKPRTEYTITVIAGQKESPSLDTAPYSVVSWNFTTTSTTTQSGKKIMLNLHCKNLRPIRR